MESLHELFRVGMGPSSSHTMGPLLAAEQFASRYPAADHFLVQLLGSLAATGKGHLTDQAIAQGLAPKAVTFSWQPETIHDIHPNGMIFQAFDAGDTLLGDWTVFSVGGGALQESRDGWETGEVYSQTSMTDLLDWASSQGQPFWKLVEQIEGPGIWDSLGSIWEAMTDCLEKGLQTEGALPGELNLQRKARSVLAKAKRTQMPMARTGYLSAYALACSEENGAGGTVVTAPTCGSCGVLPAVLYYFQQHDAIETPDILHALATAGLIGNFAKRNGSISGAEVGCQGEVGVACAMAAGAAAQILGGTPLQVEYAAEMGLEHFLGLTCDPICGLVQIPCIERNAMGALRAMDCAEYALFSDGQHRVSFDQVVRTMLQTGRHLPSLYRETAEGGLADVWKQNSPSDTPPCEK